MHGGRVLWDDAKRRDITDDHPEGEISVDEVEQVLDDPNRQESSISGTARMSSSEARSAAGCSSSRSCCEGTAGTPSTPDPPASRRQGSTAHDAADVPRSV
jgi:hypothetical protein